ncbi:DNA replication regulator SLD3-domain-containing protein [Morchella snyderi]|nr:DNA replication regulator SLD3-domain-containing protein [Morchella snyderi]
MVPTSSRKRKREDEKSVLGHPFVIKPYSSSVFDPSVKLTPAVVIPRSYIPLQWLAGYPSRLFSIPTQIQALDIPGNVIIVKIDGERQLAAVEKVKDDVCTLSKLSTQLKMKDVRKTASLIKKSRQTPEKISEDTDSMTEILSTDWWSGLEVPNFDINNAICAEECTIKLIMGCSDIDVSQDSTLLPIQPNTPISPPAAAHTPLKVVDFPEPTLTDILERTRVQYYKTLYIAKTSLAYFAKSTLSRARVAVQHEQGSKLSTSLDSSNRFRTFLLDMYLPFNKMDTKYRKSMVQVATEDPVEDISVFRVGEEEYVQQWRVATWEERLVQVNDPVMRRKVEELKIREYVFKILY